MEIRDSKKFECFVLLEDLSTSIVIKKLLEELHDKDKASHPASSESITPTKIISPEEYSVKQLKRTKRKVRSLYTFKFECPSDEESDDSFKTSTFESFMPEVSKDPCSKICKFCFKYYKVTNKHEVFCNIRQRRKSNLQVRRRSRRSHYTFLSYMN